MEKLQVAIKEMFMFLFLIRRDTPMEKKIKEAFGEDLPYGAPNLLNWYIRTMTAMNSLLAIISLFFMKFDAYHLKSLLLHLAVFAWSKIFKRI